MITIPGRIPITIQPLFWLLALFIGYTSAGTLVGTLLAVCVILYSILFHELGHALCASIFGQKTRIELAVFGGFTYREGRKLKLWEEFLVVLNGPFFGLVLFAVAYFTLGLGHFTNPSLLFVLKFTAMVNLFWTVVNLLPVLPLDGGHLLSIILQGIFGFKGIRYAIYVGLSIGSLMTIVFFVFGQYLAGALFMILTFESFRSLRTIKLLTENDREPELQSLAREAEEDQKKGELTSAIAKWERVRDSAKNGILYNTATEHLAMIEKDRQRYQEAFHLLLPIEKSLSQETIPLFHFLCFMNRDYGRVIKLGKEAYQLQPSYETALYNALAYGVKGEAEPSIGWLECSIRQGLPKVSEMLQRSEFNSIRFHPKFKLLA